MPAVFVNYRTGDGEETATTIERELSRRFGDGLVFRDNNSIRPGQAYPEALLDGLRTSGALLVVIGPRWLDAPDRRHPERRALENEEDWVRKEILEAFKRALPVIPVLVGRGMNPVEPADLPKPLARLAYSQFMRYDPHQAGPDLARIGDALVDLVPGLTEPAQTPPGTAQGSVGNTSSGNTGDGPHTQTRDVHGGVANTHIANSSGPVHTGPGDQNVHHHQVDGDGATFISGDHKGDISHQFGSPFRKKRK